MATNVFKGREATLKVAATSSGTATEVGAVRNFTISVTRPEISLGHFDSSGWEIRLDGMASWSGTMEAVFLSTGATTNEQDTLRTALTGGSRKWFSLLNSTGTGSQTFAGWAYVTGFDWSGAVDGPQLHNFTLAGDGKLTES